MDQRVGLELLATWARYEEEWAIKQARSPPLPSKEFWRLSMPIGETRDHPLANPFGPGSPNLEQVKLDPILLIVGGNELLKDRASNYATRLKGLGKDTKYIEFEGCEHGFFTHDSYSEVANEVIHILKRFMLETSA
ncbi:putative carboxylesterase 15-like protein [Trifolium pratense]|uniref:Putative carboxylesterase 15-like protein n=1 Tax=Trifolium pratense TaxID=57577 RepID=A0A2K3M053_TRIPR|nr:putative carboxylesterase 15-like protein [Trifolium pratense]